MICNCCRDTAKNFDRRKAESELAAYQRKGPGPTTRRLLDGLRAAGAGGSLLDIGSGSGILTLELLKAGVTRATCVDIAAESLAVAREEAGRRGLEARIIWQEGDFTEIADRVGSADIVALDRVVCCYPSWEGLLEAAAQRCDRWLALAYPLDRWYMRWIMGLINFGRRLRGNTFRSYVHPTAAMETMLRSAGFEASTTSDTAAWRSVIYARRQAA